MTYRPILMYAQLLGRLPLLSNRDWSMLLSNDGVRQ